MLQHVPTIEGFKVLGRIVLLEQIGAGGMGVVYRGFRLDYGIEVAVKVLLPKLAADRDFIARFCREAQAALIITHQNVVRAYGVEQGHGLWFFVMELVDGESTRQRVKQHGRLRPREALVAITGIAAGLAEAHREGLVHRDIKPANLLIASSGRVKLADLGLVHAAMDAHAPSQTGTPFGGVGTPRYMAPECWDGAAPHPTQDVWALGATLYYLVTGKHALPTLPTREMRAFVRDTPMPTLAFKLADLPALDAIYERCVARDPKARFQNAGELHAALVPLGGVDESLLRSAAPAGSRYGVPVPPEDVLDRIAAALDRPARPAVSDEPPRRRPRRKSGGGSTFLALLAVAASVACVWMYMRQNEGERAAKKADTQATAPKPAPTPSAPVVANDPPVKTGGDAAATPAPAVVAPSAAPAKAKLDSSAPAPVTPEPVQPPQEPKALRFPAATLDGWLERRDAANAYDVSFVPYRSSVVAGKKELLAAITPLDEPMKSFASLAAGAIDGAKVDAFFVVARTMRGKGEAMRPLLPWLLLLQKNDPKDARVEVCLFEAFAGADPGEAQRAEQRAQLLLAPTADTHAAAATQLQEFLFEAKAFGKGADAASMTSSLLTKCVAQVDQPLPKFALGKALVAALEPVYEAAMRTADFDTVATTLHAMLDADPSDRSPQLILAMANPKEKCTDLAMTYQVGDAGEKARIEARLRRLGLVALVGDMTAGTVIAELQKGKPDPMVRSFFDTDNAKRLALAKSAAANADTNLRDRRGKAANAESRGDRETAEALKPEIDAFSQQKKDAEGTVRKGEDLQKKLDERRRTFSLGP